MNYCFLLANFAQQVINALEQVFKLQLHAQQGPIQTQEPHHAQIALQDITAGKLQQLMQICLLNNALLEQSVHLQLV